MKEQFIDWKPNLKTTMLLVNITDILEDLGQQGYVLTLRQLYYQLVSKAIIPNDVREYHNLGRVVSKGRLAGLIDWRMIEDRVRVPKSNSHWIDGAQILQSAARGFYMDRWKDQKMHVEVWCEKDAVSNIIVPVCEEWDVLFMANRGYSSQSAMYDAYNRYYDAECSDKLGVLIYLGDHDPSGMDMARDIEDRLLTFGLQNTVVYRVALNMSQIQQYQPPKNPAKLTDSRSANYIMQYGNSSWELDALSPAVLSKIVEDAVLQRVDKSLFAKVEREEAKVKARITEIAEAFSI